MVLVILVIIVSNRIKVRVALLAGELFIIKFYIYAAFIGYILWELVPFYPTLMSYYSMFYWSISSSSILSSSAIDNRFLSYNILHIINILLCTVAFEAELY